MLRLLFTAVAAFILMGSGALAAPADKPTPAGNYTTAEHVLGGASLIPVQYYERGRVCCKRGWRDWWAYSHRSCRRNGGYVVSPRHCRNDFGNIGYRRVCCKRGWRDWWSTPRQCRRSGGYIVRNWHCRNDGRWDDDRRWDDRRGDYRDD